MDDTDDFGELYGDLGCEKEVDQIVAKPIGADSVGKKMGDIEGENDNNSDSDDDDFRIVLYENGRRKFQLLKEGINEEGECDKDNSNLNNDQRWGDQMTEVDEMTNGSKARGIAMMNGGHRSSRHVQSHLEGFSSNARPAMSGRGAWDNSMMPCFQGDASYNQDIFVASQTGISFCLPQNRSIFDINIEDFEHKPWRHRGADMSDYFNFGLDEESWKSYCGSLKQALTANGVPVFHTSRLNQGERKFSSQDSLEKRGRSFDMPKGRAIQVESGVGERIPSTDIRRPRNLDSDVVIEINMEGSVDEGSALCKCSLEQTEHTDASLSTSGNNSNRWVFSPHNDCQSCRDITNSVEHYTPELDESDFKVTNEKVKTKVDCKEDHEHLCRTDACMLEEELDSGDQVLKHSSSYNFQSHCEESKDAFWTRKDVRPIKKTSAEELQDSIESDYLSYDSISNATESEQEDGKDDAHKRSLSFGEHKHFTRRSTSAAELNVGKGNRHISSQVYCEQQKDLDLLDTRCKTRKRKPSYDAMAGERLYSYHESEIALSYKSRTHATRHHSERSCIRVSRKGERVTQRNRNLDEDDDLQKRESYFSERQHDDQDRGSLHKYYDRPITKSNSFRKDSCLPLSKEREDDQWNRMEPKYDDIIHEHRCRERSRQVMRGKHIHFREMEEEITDLKFHRHVHPTNREIRSPERSRHGRRLNFVNRSSKYVDYDKDPYPVLGFHRYEEPSNFNEREWSNSFSQREHLRVSWRSNGTYPDHRGHPNIRDLQFKNKRHIHVPRIKDHHHQMSYEDSLEFEPDVYKSEGNICSRNIVSSIHMRRFNRPLKPNLHITAGAVIRYREQRGSPSPERFLEESSSKHDNFQVNKPFFFGRRLLGDRLANNARKRRVIMGTPDSDARDNVNIVPATDKHEMAAVGCWEAVSKHLNGIKGKLTSRHQKEIDAGYKINTQLKNSKNHKKAIKQEIQLEKPKGECSYTHQTSLKVNMTKEGKPFNKIPISQNVIENEIEEGEFIEESDKKDAISTTKKIENFQSKDNSCSLKVAGIYDKSHILKTLAKMEKRKERFKEPIASNPKEEIEKDESAQMDVPVILDEAKQLRPARKRRWGGH